MGLGRRVFKWPECYLMDRMQKIAIGDEQSEPWDLVWGNATGPVLLQLLHVTPFLRSIAAL